jgi:predicted dehydrogenase
VTRTLNAAVVGAGLMGRWHADAISAAGSRVVAVVDEREESAASLARRYRARPACSLPAVLGSVDVVHICTPVASHSALVAAALAAGRHALVEKPLAADAPETESLLKLAATQGVLLCPVHQFVFLPGVQAAAERLPRLAPIQHVDVQVCSAGADGRTDDARDRVACEILPHPLSLAARILPLGGPVEWAVMHPRPGEIRALGRSGEVTISVTVSMAGRPTRNELRIIGSGGTAVADLFHGFGVFERPGVSRWRKIVHPFAVGADTLWAAGTNLAWRTVRLERAYPGLRELVRRFHAAANTGGSPPLPPAETMWVARQVDAIMAGSRQR